MVLGVCYKKCSLLTHGEFPFRTAAATCCKTHGFGCLSFFNAKTSSSFNVGGGADDNDPLTPAESHLPNQQLTESEQKQAITTTTPSPRLFVQDAHFEPIEHLHDGNVCDDEEELYGGLCYKKCGLLTNGQAPIRTSSWTCCKSHPCGLRNQMGSLGHTIICKGYDVDAAGSCPHKPGTCLVDEEMVLGVCYAKCSLLTNGAFPYRMTAATCCKGHGLGCLNPWNARTSDAFDKGGGGNSDGFSDAHLPDQSLTEAGPQHLERSPSASPLLPSASQQQKTVGDPRETATHETASMQVRRDASVSGTPDGRQRLPLGAAVEAPKHQVESKAERQAREALEAQAAVTRIIRAMK